MEEHLGQVPRPLGCVTGCEERLALVKEPWREDLLDACERYFDNSRSEKTLWRLSDGCVYLLENCERAMLGSFAAVVEIRAQGDRVRERCEEARRRWASHPSLPPSSPWEIRHEVLGQIAEGSLKNKARAYPEAAFVLKGAESEERAIRNQIMLEVEKERKQTTGRYM